MRCCHELIDFVDYKDLYEKYDAFEKCKCDLFYLTMALFVFAPVIKIGIGADFRMRATVPAVIILMTMCIDTLKKWVVAKNQNADITLKNKIMYMILVTASIIGMFTPAMEFYRGIYKVTEGQRLNLVADDIY